MTTTKPNAQTGPSSAVVAGKPQPRLDPATRVEVWKRIEMYGLIFLEFLQHSQSMSGFASGTLVRYRDHYGILTARHVLEAIEAKGSNVLYAPTVGVIIRQEARESGAKLPPIHDPWWYRQDGEMRVVKGVDKVVRDDGSPISPALADRAAYRPDLGVMIVSERMRSNLAATSSFYNLEKGMKEHARVAGSDDSRGCYVVQGLLGSRQEYRVDASGESVFYSMLWGMQSTTGEKYSKTTDGRVYDYRNFLATDEGGRPDTVSGASSWAGMSGSGLWEVVADFSVDGGRKAHPQGGAMGSTNIGVILSGVAFAEDWVRCGPADGPPDVIYCHSDRSIYPRVIEILSGSLPENS